LWVHEIKHDAGEERHTGNPSHPGREMRALRKLQREQDPVSPFVFMSERDLPFATAGFARLVELAPTRFKDFWR
jgi:hypothetical protein